MWFETGRTGAFVGVGTVSVAVSVSVTSIESVCSLKHSSVRSSSSSTPNILVPQRSGPHPQKLSVSILWMSLFDLVAIRVFRKAGHCSALTFRMSAMIFDLASCHCLHLVTEWEMFFAWTADGERNIFLAISGRLWYIAMWCWYACSALLNSIPLYINLVE